MKKAVRILITFSTLLFAFVAFSAYAKSANLHPPNFLELLKSFEGFDVSVESLRYLRAPNNISFNLRTTKENTTSEDFIPMLEAIAEYLKSEQFIDYFERFSQRMGDRNWRPEYHNLEVNVQFLRPIAGEGLWFESTPNTNFTEWWLGLEQVLPRD